jgi:hypothetical protein
MVLYKKRLYDAVYDFMLDSLSVVEAKEKAMIIVEQIDEVYNEIEELITNDIDNPSVLSKKYHTLKNLLLYGDFYYESDLCQDIEEKLRETSDISSILPIQSELDSILKNV